MAFLWSSNLVDAVTNHLASYVSDASLCSRIVMNWLVQLYACYVHCWFLHLFTCNHGDMQTPFLGKPYTATSPPLFLHSDDSSHRADFHTNSSPQTSPLAVHEEDLRRIFESLDDDKDGMVSGHDIQRLLQNLGLRNNNKLASAHDDGDDEDEQYFVNFDDYSLILKKIGHRRVWWKRLVFLIRMAMDLSPTTTFNDSSPAWASKKGVTWNFAEV